MYYSLLFIIPGWAHPPVSIRVPHRDSLPSPPAGSGLPHFGIHRWNHRHGAAPHPAGSGHLERAGMCQRHGGKHLGHRWGNLKTRGGASEVWAWVSCVCCWNKMRSRAEGGAPISALKHKLSIRGLSPTLLKDGCLNPTKIQEEVEKCETQY